MSQPVPTNPTADFANGVIAGVNNSAVKFVETIAIAKAAFLGWPIIKQMFELLLSWLFGIASKAEQAGVTFIIIDTQVSNEKAAFGKALADLSIAHASGDPIKIQQAIKEYSDAHSALINWDGASQPK